MSNVVCPTRAPSTTSARREERSARIQLLIRRGSWIALNPTEEWLDSVDRATLVAHPSIAEDPALAAVVSRNNRATLVHFATAKLRDPCGAVPPSVGPEQLRMARELARRDLDKLALEIYRIGHNMALRRWTEIAFELTSDPEELRELLVAPVQAANEFVDATLTGLEACMRLEHDALTGDVRAQQCRIVEQLLEGDPVGNAPVEEKLGYPFARSHVAAVIWTDNPGCGDLYLDRAAGAFAKAMGCPHPLTVAPNTATRWVWVNDVAACDKDRIHQALSNLPDVRIAIGTILPGVDGFRRSHFAALKVQRMFARLRSPQQVAFSQDVQMVALLTHKLDSVDDFVKDTLGDLASASPLLRATLRAYINEQCNVSRAAKALYVHRNTLTHRLEAAERMLPRPLDHTSVQVGVALEILCWRGTQSGGPADGPHKYAEHAEADAPIIDRAVDAARCAKDLDTA